VAAKKQKLEQEARLFDGVAVAVLRPDALRQTEALRRRIELEARRVHEHKAAAEAAKQREQQQAEAAQRARQSRLQAGFTSVRPAAVARAAARALTRTRPRARPCSGRQQPPADKRLTQPVLMLHAGRRTRLRLRACWAR